MDKGEKIMEGKMKKCLICSILILVLAQYNNAQENSNIKSNNENTVSKLDISKIVINKIKENAKDKGVIVAEIQYGSKENELGVKGGSFCPSAFIVKDNAMYILDSVNSRIVKISKEKTSQNFPIDFEGDRYGNDLIDTNDGNIVVVKPYSDFEIKSRKLTEKESYNLFTEKQNKIKKLKEKNEIEEISNKVRQTKERYYNNDDKLDYKIIIPVDAAKNNSKKIIQKCISGNCYDWIELNINSLVNDINSEYYLAKDSLSGIDKNGTIYLLWELMKPENKFYESAKQERLIMVINKKGNIVNIVKLRKEFTYKPRKDIYISKDGNIFQLWLGKNSGLIIKYSNGAIKS